MNVIVLTKRGRSGRCIDLYRWPTLAALLAVGGVVLSGAYLAGFHVAANWNGDSRDPMAVALQGELDAQRHGLEAARETLRERLNGLAARVGGMQAHVIRLDALGSRLTQMAALDNGEFNFGEAPAQGGPVARAGEDTPVSLPGLLLELGQLDGLLADRALQLDVLESFILSRNLQAEVYPEGRPVDAGWISSYFGSRIDPFTGRKAAHHGIDFAGREGAAIKVVAAGVVSYSSTRVGYGNVVEVTHGNGYVTRYAHNKANLVARGDRVEKGQAIALMGTTGRATGPNLHFEVLRNGRAVNPLKYIQQQR